MTDSDNSVSRFLLSRKARALQRNFHVFSFHQRPRAVVAGGWNLDRHPLTAAHFFRWLNLSEAYSSPDLALSRITIMRIDVLRYVVCSYEGKIIPRSSQEDLQPGFYGFVKTDGSPFPWLMGSKQAVTFEQLDDFLATRRAQPPSAEIDAALKDIENQIPEAVAKAASVRDAGTCCMTGRTDLPTSLVWILPPASAQGREKADFRVVENLVTMCSALAVPFYQNRFSVDFEDSQRVVTFQDLTTDAPDLQQHIAVQPGAETFWMLSFTHSLRVHFPGGDPASDYKQSDAEKWMEELRTGDSQLDDPKWQTPLGREALEVHLERQMALEAYWQTRDGRERNDLVCPRAAGTGDTSTEGEGLE